MTVTRMWGKYRQFSKHLRLLDTFGVSIFLSLRNRLRNMQTDLVSPSASSSQSRIYFLDNLRTILIFLVVLNHSGLVYESSGVSASFWIVDDPNTNHISGLVNLVIDIFVMVTFFLVSGFFSAKSCRKKGRFAFIMTRFSWLIIPWLVGVLLLMPLYKWLFLLSRNLPQESLSSYLYFNNGILSQSWLWFLPVLFAFSVLYSVFESQILRLGKYSMRTIVVLMLMIGLIYSFSMDWFAWRGWTKTPWFDFQNERLLIYAMAFVLGAIMFEKRSLQQKLVSGWVYHTMNSIVFVPVGCYLVFLLYPFLYPDAVLVSTLADKLIKWTCFHLSIFCLTLIALETCRRYLDKPNKWFELFNKHALTIYLVHVIVLGLVAFGLLQFDGWSMVKYLILTLATFLGSFVVSLGFQFTKAIMMTRRPELRKLQCQGQTN